MTYEYICLACQHEWEAEQSISAKPLTECPQCHDSTAKRMVSGGAGFILKGGGWYADGYGLKGGAAKTDTSKDSTASSAAPASDSSEKKDTKKAGETSASGSDSTGKTAST
ncbi:MAG TPA: zinc ribbon domain-containing protein [Polyangiaceae bacterium]|nr:zinc ribbon domain-containing protein [Polyangiaceae bacterium]